MTEAGVRHVLAAVAAHRRFLVTGHIDPDPDALGSVLAMTHLLRRMGKEAVPASPDPVPDIYAFLPGAAEIALPAQLSGSFDALVVLDCDPGRIGALASWREQVMTVINIDHHETNPRTAPIYWVEPRAAALGEMIYRLYQEVGVEIEEDQATCLYTAIMTDTGSFRFSNTTPETLAIAADLVARGANPAAISERVFGERSWAYVQLLIQSLNTLQRSEDGRIAWLTVSQEMMERTGARPDETDGFIQFARMIAGVKVAILFRELPSGDTKVSWRSRDPVDVSRLAESFGGGGHPRAAGALLKKPLAEAREIVLRGTAHYLQALQEQAGAGGRVRP